MSNTRDTNERTTVRTVKHTYDVYWSPEGRKIARIEARSEKAAIRKAPQPYRKYLGEIYAVLVNENEAAI